MPLHHCDYCHERSEVWKRTATGKHFSYCINPGCPSNRKEVSPSRKKVLDKNRNSGIIKITTPEINRPDKIGTTQMTYRDAEILITEAKNLGYRGTNWERSFLQRLEAERPEFLLPTDTTVVEEFYRRATGGGFRVSKRSLSNNPEVEF